MVAQVKAEEIAPPTAYDNPLNQPDYRSKKDRLGDFSGLQLGVVGGVRSD